jgi:acid stress-induced BolA-like protein IbaG/YrbA
MTPETIQALIAAGIPDCQVEVQGDGSHFDAVVVSDAFAGLSLVKKQQLVYGTLGDRIATGEIHALSIKTFTRDEYEAN